MKFCQKIRSFQTPDNKVKFRVVNGYVGWFGIRRYAEMSFSKPQIFETFEQAMSFIRARSNFRAAEWEFDEYGREILKDQS